MRALLLFIFISLNAFSQQPIQSPNNYANDENVITHVVRQNENLYRIALKYSVSVEQIKQLNNLQNDVIESGQTLIISLGEYVPPLKEYKIISDSVVIDTLPHRIEPATKPDSADSKTSSDSSVEIIPANPATITGTHREYQAVKMEGNIVIDGIPDEPAWKLAMVADSFFQRDPVEGAPITQKTEVRLLYSNSAIYISAIMHDTHADSILHQLGNRDEADQLNTDLFKFGLDPYNNRQSGYVFEVSASGVQAESFNDDLSFDAVWQSAATCIADGWMVEMKIPYSAIRFPAVEEQVWAVQFARLIRRNREYDQWALTPKNQQNPILNWGTMHGIKNINPPLRLSLTPYVSFYGENAPVTDENGNTTYEKSYSYSGGADLKWGINESFTVDLTLLPDFSQVQSDNKVKNLSAYETFYDEKRPFFKEGTELFTKGDLLYTRRIGREPVGFNSVADNLNPGETIKENPDKAKLLNAAKLSGRTQSGLGIGLLNAVTDNTYAVVRSTDGKTRKILTEPFSNYNLIILDQQLKNNCGVTLVNTNVTREGSERDANVTLAGGKFENAKHQYRIQGSYSESHIYEWQDSESGVSSKQNIRGQKYFGNIDKISGVSQYGVSYNVLDNKYDKNDFGYLSSKDYTEASAYYTFYKFNPFWKYFKQGNITFYGNRRGRYSNNNQLSALQTGMNFFLLFNSNWSFYYELNVNPVGGKDWDEPRIAGKYFNKPKSHSGYLYMSTNYNKPLAFDFGASYYSVPEWHYLNTGYFIIPMIRLSDKFNITINSSVYFDKDDIGFSYMNDGGDTSYFGQRDVVTVTNSFTSRYIFKNDMSLSFTARHYWSKGNYASFSRLGNNGDLTPVDVAQDAIDDYDFNSNYFTVDVVYNWQFAPGSSFLVTYKNQIYADTQEDIPHYFTNLKNTFSDPQNNSISLKVLYYLDYQYFKREK
jgi:LysM repeat protein